MNNDIRPMFPVSSDGLDELAESILEGSVSDSPSESVGVLQLDDLLRSVEEKAQYSDASNKKVLTYNDALADLKTRGCKRFLSPAEAFMILIDYLKNPSGKSKTIAEDMLKSCGEWLNIVWQVKADKLIVYNNPENLSWNGTIYEVKGGAIKHSGTKEYNIAGIPTDELVDLSRMPEQFQKDFYTKKFSELPDKMKSGNQRAQVYIRNDSNIWPVGRGINLFSILGLYDGRAVRGVRASAR